MKDSILDNLFNDYLNSNNKKNSPGLDVLFNQSPDVNNGKTANDTEDNINTADTKDLEDLIITTVVNLLNSATSEIQTNKN